MSDLGEINPLLSSTPGSSQHGHDASETLQIRKYPNRSYYDTTRRRHLTFESIYHLLKQGHTIRVTEVKKGTDLTNDVLLRVLLEYEPEKVQKMPRPFLIQLLKADVSEVKQIIDSPTLHRSENQNPATTATPFNKRNGNGYHNGQSNGHSEQSVSQTVQP